MVAAGSNLNVSEGNASVYAWYPGQAGGTALAELLFGEKNFSGHLPLTFYRGVDDLPAFEDYSMKNRTYRYFSGETLYPFGFGLSYTRFEMAGALISGNEVTAEVANSGERDGDALVQVYVSCESKYAPPNPRLCGFRRIFLKAGRTGKVTVPLDPLTDTVVNNLGEREKVYGYTLYVGLCQPDEQSIRMTGSRPVILKKQTEV